MFGDPDERFEKKIYKIGKSAAYSLGGGIALWGMMWLYPHPEGSERVTNALGPIGWLLVIYGIVMLTLIIVRKNAVPMVNFLFMALIIPACLIYIFVNNWGG